MTSRLLLLLVLCAALALQAADAAVVRLVHSLLRNNLAGTPDNFQTQKWRFDPQAAYHWRDDYRRANGIRGEDLIERAGLGEDGRAEERRAQQALRDRGEYVSRQPLRGP